VKNILEAQVVSVAGGSAELLTRGGNRLRATDDGGYVTGATVIVGVRPERLTLAGADAGAGENAFAGKLDDEIYLGDWTDWRVRLGEEVVSVAEGASAARHRRRGDAVTVRVPPEAILRLEESDSARA
jgi:ABC-type Fe3+/spermidine/putrescine transport system ATPase subunit